MLTSNLIVATMKLVSFALNAVRLPMSETNSIALGNPEYAYWLRQDAGYGKIYLLSERRCPFCTFEGSRREKKVKNERHFVRGEWLTVEQVSFKIIPLVNYRIMLNHMKETHTIFETKEFNPELYTAYDYDALDPNKPEHAEELARIERIRKGHESERTQEQFIFGILQQCVIVETRLDAHNVKQHKDGRSIMRHDKSLGSGLWKLNHEYDVPQPLLRKLFPSLSNVMLGELLYLGLTVNRACKDWMANSI